MLLQLAFTLYRLTRDNVDQHLLPRLPSRQEGPTYDEAMRQPETCTSVSSLACGECFLHLPAIYRQFAVQLATVLIMSRQSDLTTLAMAQHTYPTPGRGVFLDTDACTIVDKYASRPDEDRA